MSKRVIIFLVILAMISLPLIVCCVKGKTNDLDEVAMEMLNLREVEGEENKVYDLETRVVYYMCTTKATGLYTGYGHSYFAPYISENGKYCRYINDEIVEITEENTNN